MTEIIKVRARYVGDNHSDAFFKNNTFYFLKMKQDGLKIIIIQEGDESKKSKTEYNTLGDFFDKWNIYAVINVTRK